MISERHRHRYEFNNVFRQQFAANGMVFSGTSQNNALVEIIELKDHPWFVAVQYHPEFKSKPTRPHALFSGLVAAAVRRHGEKEKPGVHPSDAAELVPPYTSLESE